MYTGRRASGTLSSSANASNATNGGTTTTMRSRDLTATATRSSSSQQQQQQQQQQAAQFQPKLIASQIVALQCLHYFVWALLIQINAVLYGSSITIDRIFTDHFILLWSVHGWPDALAVLLAASIGLTWTIVLVVIDIPIPMIFRRSAVLLVVIVGKSKNCLDFSVTLFLLHCFISTIYGGFPTRLDWWVVHVASTIVMILLGEYLCSKRELDEIPLLSL